MFHCCTCIFLDSEDTTNTNCIKPISLLKAQCLFSWIRQNTSIQLGGATSRAARCDPVIPDKHTTRLRSNAETTFPEHLRRLGSLPSNILSQSQLKGISLSVHSKIFVSYIFPIFFVIKKEMKEEKKMRAVDIFHSRAKTCAHVTEYEHLALLDSAPLRQLHFQRLWKFRLA